jgi:hypothetical protein
MPTPLINGINYAGSNVSVNPFGTPLQGITAISWSEEQQKDDNYGLGVEPISRGYGMKKYTASMEVYLDEVMAFIAAAPNKSLMQIPPFDIPITFGGTGVLVNKVVLRSCEFKNSPVEVKSGDTKILVKLDLAIAGVQNF